MRICGTTPYSAGSNWIVRTVCQDAVSKMWISLPRMPTASREPSGWNASPSTSFAYFSVCTCKTASWRGRSAMDSRIAWSPSSVAARFRDSSASSTEVGSRLARSSSSSSDWLPRECASETWLCVSASAWAVARNRFSAIAVDSAERAVASEICACSMDRMDALRCTQAKTASRMVMTSAVSTAPVVRRWRRRASFRLARMNCWCNAVGWVACWELVCPSHASASSRSLPRSRNARSRCFRSHSSARTCSRVWARVQSRSVCTAVMSCWKAA